LTTFQRPKHVSFGLKTRTHGPQIHRNPLQIHRNPLQIHRKSTPNCPGIYLISLVLDVMLQTHSSPRPEGPSPPLLRCTLLKKCSYKQLLTVELGALQLQRHSAETLKKQRPLRAGPWLRSGQWQRLVEGCPEGSIHRPKLG
jgi:hypothetical protein